MMRRISISLPCLWIASWLAMVAPAARAQGDRSAGLFTEARQLPLVAQHVRLDVTDGAARLTLEQTFANRGETIAQADYRLHLPTGASVDAFGFWQGETFLAATLKERETAERAHRAAAAAGASTGLLKREGTVHDFSVFPVAAEARQRVRTVIRLPITTEGGRSHVVVPVDRFLGQPSLRSTLLVMLGTDEPLADFGVEGQRVAVLDRRDRSATLALSADHAVTLWWATDAPPLLAAAEAVAVEDQYAWQLRFGLDDASAWRVPYDELVLLVDTSYSMRRRAATVKNVVERALAQRLAPIRVVAVTGEGTRTLTGDDALALTRDLLDPYQATFAVGWLDLLRAVAEEGCGGPGKRCLLLTDPQAVDLDDMRPVGVDVLFLADPAERAYFAAELGEGAMIHQPGVDGRAQLDAWVDQCVRAALELVAIEQDGAPLTLPGGQGRRVAEGGLLRLFALSNSLSPVVVRMRIEGTELEHRLTPEVVREDGGQGQAIRHGTFREVLAGWMADYRREPSAEAKKSIVALSLREKIPTAFTALHVADPRLSLASIKPGDPLLTVPAVPGLTRVVAWYPFGEQRALVRMLGEDRFSDRFLVPRGWDEKGYRILVEKHYDDGRVEHDGVWYRLDDRGPAARIRHDRTAGTLRIVPEESASAVAAVEVHQDGGVQVLAPFEGVWTMAVDELDPSFAVVLRDRAGNRRRYDGVRRAAGVEVREAVHASPGSAGMPGDLALWAEGEGLTIDAGLATLRFGDEAARFPTEGLVLRSLDVGALLRLDEHTLLVGTRAGDLLRLRCDRVGVPCAPTRLAPSLGVHPITGLARHTDGTILVSVLGRGLFRLGDHDRLTLAGFDVGSRYVVGLERLGGQTFVATAYNGLWRLVGERAIKTRFGRQHVSGLALVDGRLEVMAGGTRFLRRGRDRFRALDTPAPIAKERTTMTGVALADGFAIGAFDGGLTVRGTTIPALDGAQLTVDEERINALVSWQGALWVGSEGGLLRIPLRPDATASEIERYTGEPVYGLAASPIGLAVATGNGLYRVDAHAVEGSTPTVTRLDDQGSPGSFTAVAWWGDGLVAGGMDGLVRVAYGETVTIGIGQGFDGGWVTALLADGDRLLVGTYDRGVYTGDGHRFESVEGLAHQWVPPGALARIDGALWVGGMGMPPVRMTDDGRPMPLAVPALDTNGAVGGTDGTVLLLTSGGPMLARSTVTPPAREALRVAMGSR